MRTSIISSSFVLAIGMVACSDDPPSSLSPFGASMSVTASFPDVISLPNGFRADGIAFGSGSTFYVGSNAAGAIWRGDARTGAGDVFVPPHSGRAACAIAFDQPGNRLFVAGSATGQAYVYDATTGATLDVFQLADPATGPTSILDVVVLRDAVYFTDAARPVLYRMPLGPNRSLPPHTAVQAMPYSGDFRFLPGGPNTTGIVATSDEHWLIVASAKAGILYRVDPSTAQTTAIGLGGASIPFGDGLALIGHELYVAQIPLNHVSVLRLDADFASGAVEQTLTSGLLDFPSKIAPFGSGLYAVNARFEVPPGPDVTYRVVRLPR